MKLTNKQKAQLRGVAPQCADRLAEEIWNILDLNEITCDVLGDVFLESSPTKEVIDSCRQLENYLMIQIRKHL